MGDRWIVTFGQRYRRERHPSFADAHPDGWVVIVADDEWQARDTAMRLFGEQWAFLYSEGEFFRLQSAPLRQLYPRGEIGLFHVGAMSEIGEGAVDAEA